MQDFSKLIRLLDSAIKDLQTIRFGLEVKGQKIDKPIDVKKIDNIVWGGIDHKDWPDFSDAYIEAANYEGRPMTDEELDRLNDYYSDWVHFKLLNHLEGING